MTKQKSPFSKPSLTRHDGFLRVTQQPKPLVIWVSDKRGTQRFQTDGGDPPSSNLPNEVPAIRDVPAAATDGRQRCQIRIHGSWRPGLRVDAKARQLVVAPMAVEKTVQSVTDTLPLAAGVAVGFADDFERLAFDRAGYFARCRIDWRWDPRQANL